MATLLRALPPILPANDAPLRMELGAAVQQSHGFLLKVLLSELAAHPAVISNL